MVISIIYPKDAVDSLRAQPANGPVDNCWQATESACLYYNDIDGTYHEDCVCIVGILLDEFVSSSYYRIYCNKYNIN